MHTLDSPPPPSSRLRHHPVIEETLASGHHRPKSSEWPSIPLDPLRAREADRNPKEDSKRNRSHSLDTMLCVTAASWDSWEASGNRCGKSRSFHVFPQTVRAERAPIFFLLQQDTSYVHPTIAYSKKKTRQMQKKWKKNKKQISKIQKTQKQNRRGKKGKRRKVKKGRKWGEKLTCPFAFILFSRFAFILHLFCFLPGKNPKKNQQKKQTEKAK